MYHFISKQSWPSKSLIQTTYSSLC